MKILKTYSGAEYQIEDDEAINIIKVKNSGQKAFLELRCGDHVDVSAIESITKIPLVPTRNGRIVMNGGWYIRDGQKVYVDWNDVVYIPDPRRKMLFEETKRIAVEEKLRLPKPSEIDIEGRKKYEELKNANGF